MASLGALTFLNRTSRKFYKHGGPYLSPQRYVTTTYYSLPRHFHPANALRCNEFRLSVPGLKVCTLAYRTCVFVRGRKKGA